MSFCMNTGNGDDGDLYAAMAELLRGRHRFDSADVLLMRLEDDARRGSMEAADLVRTFLDEAREALDQCRFRSARGAMLDALEALSTLERDEAVASACGSVQHALSGGAGGDGRTPVWD